MCSSLTLTILKLHVWKTGSKFRIIRLHRVLQDLGGGTQQSVTWMWTLRSMRSTPTSPRDMRGHRHTGADPAVHWELITPRWGHRSPQAQVPSTPSSSVTWGLWAPRQWSPPPRGRRAEKVYRSPRSRYEAVSVEILKSWYWSLWSRKRSLDVSSWPFRTRYIVGCRLL